MKTENLSLIKEHKTYLQYSKETEDLLQILSSSQLNDSDKERLNLIKLNLQRSSRLDKTFAPSDETRQVFTKISEKQIWVAITENWCADSAQNIPIIAKLSQLNKMVELRIVLRDSNLNFMDLYLTNGGRGIPKLISFDENDNELFQWGPRPLAAKELFTRLKNDGIEKSEIIKEIQLWYGRNRGLDCETEIRDLVNKLNVK